MLPSHFHSTPTWDGTALLGIINTDTGTFTCVGYAPTEHRRCRYTIAAHNQKAARSILAELPIVNFHHAQLRQKLLELAQLSICRKEHQDQAQMVAEGWFAALKVERSRNHHTPPASSGQNTSNRPSQDDPEEKLRRLQDEMEEMRDILRNQERTERPRERKQREQSRRTAEERPRQEENQREEERRQEEERREEGEEEEEEERHQEEERRQEEKERRREGEQRRQEESLRQAERERTEREARARRERNRAESQSAEAERAEQKRQQWHDSWARYNREWDNKPQIGTSALNDDVRDSLPWPVVDGLWQQVNETNVERFFSQVPNGVASNRRKFMSLLKRQALRWHEDKIRQHFPTVGGNPETLTLTSLVMQVINKLMGRLRAQE